MAEQKLPEQAIVNGTNDKVSTRVVYALKSVSSGNYLDGRTNDEDPLMTNRNPKGDKFLNWTIHKTNLGYAIKSISSGNYLDGRTSDSNPLMTNRDPTNDKFLNWTFQVTDGGHIAIKSVSSGNYLDGRTNAKEPLLTNRPPKSDIFLQWIFIPQNYKLKAVIADFDFGDQKEIEQQLEKNKTVAFADKKTIRCEQIGISVEGSYGEEVQQSFSFSFTETIGVGVETEVSCGVPMLAEAKVKVSTTFSFSSTQQKTTTDTKNFQSKYSFTPKEKGIFEVGMIVSAVKNQPLPYNAKVTIVAVTDDAESKPYSGEEVKALLYYGGFNANVVSVGKSDVTAKISGNLTASFAVSSQVYNKKIADL